MQAFKGTSLRLKLIYASLIIIFGCQNPIANEVPFLFYHSDMECLINEEWVLCSEQVMCENNYQYRWLNEGYQSVSMQQELVCEAKLIEATLIFLGPLAQFIAMTGCALIDIPKEKKFKFLITMLFIQSTCVIMLQFVSESILAFSIIWFVWNAIWSMVFAIIQYYIKDNFSKAVFLITPSLLNLVWPTGGLIFVGGTYKVGNWVDQCVLMTGVPMFCSAVLFFLLAKNLESDSNGQLEEGLISGDKNQEAPLSPIQEMVQKFKEVSQNKVYLKNMIFYISSWVIAMWGINATFIAFNEAKGNISTNVLVSVIFEMAGSIIAMALIIKYDCFKVLEINFFVIGVFQALTFVVSTPFTQMAVINLTKVSNKITFAAILLYLQYILPQRYAYLTFNMTNSISITANSLLPYFKYFMDQIGINFFGVIGVLSIISTIFIKKSIKVCDPKENKEESQDQEMTNIAKNSKVKSKN